MNYFYHKIQPTTRTNKILLALDHNISRPLKLTIHVIIIKNIYISLFYKNFNFKFKPRTNVTFKNLRSYLPPQILQRQLNQNHLNLLKF